MKIREVFRQSDGWRYVFVADFEALSCQVTRKFIRCRNAETPTISAIKYTACYHTYFFVFSNVGKDILFGKFWHLCRLVRLDNVYGFKRLHQFLLIIAYDILNTYVFVRLKCARLTYNFSKIQLRHLIIVLKK